MQKVELVVDGDVPKKPVPPGRIPPERIRRLPRPGPASLVMVSR